MIEDDTFFPFPDSELQVAPGLHDPKTAAKLEAWYGVGITNLSLTPGAGNLNFGLTH